MTREELKERYTIRDVVQRYGIQPNRAGFICCPFHQGDREPSMKLYEKDFHCHACGSHGDIFTFVQKMENVSFKEAFLSLGGEYQKSTFASKLEVYRSQKRREMTLLEASKAARRKALNAALITVYREWSNRLEPLSEAWCDCMNALQQQLNLQEEINLNKEKGW